MPVLFKLSIRHPYAISLFIAAVVILAAGVRFRPSKTNTPGPLSESDIARNQQAIQFRQLSDLSQFLSAAADKAKERLLYLDSTPHTAVIWDNEHAISSLSPEPAIALIGAHGAAIRLQAVPISPGVPLQVLIAPAQFPRDGGERGALPVIPNGEWLIAVARSSENRVIFAHGIYQGITSARCGAFEYQQVNTSAALSDALSGGGLFTLQGLLLGTIFSCHGQMAVAGVETISSFINRPVPIADQIQRAVGIQLTDPIDSQGAFPIQVTAVWSGTAGKAAGLLPGDTITELNGKAVRSLSELSQLADTQSRPPQLLTILRGRRKRTVTIAGSESASGQGTVGLGDLILAGDPERAQVAVRSVAPDGVWANAGVQSGDVLLRIDGVRVTGPEQAARLLTAHLGRPLAIAIRRGEGEADVLIVENERP